MSRRRKVTIIAAAAVGVASTPLVWLAGSPNAGQVVGASGQVAVGIVALLWAMFHQPTTSEPVSTAVDTGKAKGTRGGNANTGVRRPKGLDTSSVRAERTGDAVADGFGSSANTGIEYT